MLCTAFTGLLCMVTAVWCACVVLSQAFVCSCSVRYCSLGRWATPNCCSSSPRVVCSGVAAASSQGRQNDAHSCKHVIICCVHTRTEPAPAFRVAWCCCRCVVSLTNGCVSVTSKWCLRANKARVAQVVCNAGVPGLGPLQRVAWQLGATVSAVLLGVCVSVLWLGGQYATWVSRLMSVKAYVELGLRFSGRVSWAGFILVPC